LTKKLGDALGEETGAVAEEIGDVEGEEVGDGVLMAMDEVTDEEWGDRVKSCNPKLLSAPEKNTTTNKLTIIAPAMTTFFAELFLFRLPVRGVGVMVISFLIMGCGLVSCGLE
jgi:hypothetical protein